MFVLSLIVFFGFIFVLPVIINYFLPDYSESIKVIKILAWTIPFMFLHIPGATILMSTDKFLKTIICLSLLTLGFNVLLNFLLIPQYGFIGASWVTVLSEALSFIIFFGLLYFGVLKKHKNV